MEMSALTGGHLGPSLRAPARAVGDLLAIYELRAGRVLEGGVAVLEEEDQGLDRDAFVRGPGAEVVALRAPSATPPQEIPP